MGVYKMLLCEWNDWSPWHKGSQKHNLSNSSMGFWTRSFDIQCKMLCTITHTTHIVKCVLVVGMHQNEYGGRMCDDFWV